ncbi:MAG: hypothetical protein K9J27_10210 [Bacteroidales bacterium]|nr:hypothetical protein [Bacteroidales bacterium]MCF8334435.1 hypothetical protein [Bacteroidales bacterium]
MWHYSEIPPSGQVYILMYVRLPSPKREITEYLKARHYIEGKHFLQVG